MFTKRFFPLLLTITLLSASAHAAPITDASPTAQIDQLLAAAFPPNAPGAAVLVINKNEPLLRKAYGLANLELQIPADPNQVFRICSVTKQFTAVAILQLVDAGKLRLEDPITAYVDYPSAANVTLAQLLTHTSGISNPDNQEWAKIWRQDLTVPQVLALTKDKPLAFPPGTDFQYSNTGYYLLGIAIEKVSGQSYADYIQSHIFAPAGMTHSYYDTPDRIIPHRVPGYVRAGKAWVNAPFISMTQPFSAGSILSTVDDLWKWEQALTAGKLISPALLAKTYTPAQLPDGRSTNYGFGWEINRLGNHRTIQHGGGMPGYTAQELRIPDAGIYIAILCNAYDLPIAPRTLATQIARILLNETIPALPAIPAATLQEYTGAYRIAPNQSFTVTLENGNLLAQLGSAHRPLAPLSANEFTAPGSDMSFTFLRDPNHHINRIEVHPDGPGPAFVWPRINENQK